MPLGEQGGGAGRVSARCHCLLDLGSLVRGQWRHCRFDSQAVKSGLFTVRIADRGTQKQRKARCLCLGPLAQKSPHHSARTPLRERRKGRAGGFIERDVMEHTRQVTARWRGALVGVEARAEARRGSCTFWVQVPSVP